MSQQIINKVKKNKETGIEYEKMTNQEMHQTTGNVEER